MRIVLNRENTGLESGLKLVSQRMGLTAGEVLTVTPVQGGCGLSVKRMGNAATVEYRDRAAFFRAVGLMAEHREDTTFAVSERAHFETCGMMLDCANNIVPRIEHFQDFLVTMAIMGLNAGLFYTEDAIEVEGYPYLGYMRGRYTQAEMRQLDDFADMLGIELIPAIQTLGHLNQFLRWGAMSGIAATPHTLLMDEEKTYQFIEESIRQVSQCFRSKQIHIGMDEATDAISRAYADKFGRSDILEALLRHLNRVVGITEKYGLSSMIWSDMFFSSASKTHNYYDMESQVPESVAKRIPNVGLVYWDYDGRDQARYESMIEKHQKLGKSLAYAGGVWDWGMATTNYEMTFKTLSCGLRAAKKKGVSDFWLTLWNAFAPTDEVLPAMQFCAEHCYREEVSQEYLKQRFFACTGASFDAFMALDLDSVEGYTDKEAFYRVNKNAPNITMQILWQDILMGLFDKNFSLIDLAAYYKKRHERLLANQDSFGSYGYLFDYTEKLAQVLGEKVDMGIRLKAAYDAGDREGLTALVTELTRLRESYEALQEENRRLWMTHYKPQGFEILDLYYGGAEARITTAAKRVTDYLEGRIPCIEELMEERLFWGGENDRKNSGLLRCAFYNEIVSASNFSGQHAKWRKLFS